MASRNGVWAAWAVWAPERLRRSAWKEIEKAFSFVTAGVAQVRFVRVVSSLYFFTSFYLVF